MFLIADTRLYTLPCRSVHPSTGPSQIFLKLQAVFALLLLPNRACVRPYSRGFLRYFRWSILRILNEGKDDPIFGTQNYRIESIIFHFVAIGKKSIFLLIQFWALQLQLPQSTALQLSLSFLNCLNCLYCPYHFSILSIVPIISQFSLLSLSFLNWLSTSKREGAM